MPNPTRSTQTSGFAGNTAYGGYPEATVGPAPTALQVVAEVDLLHTAASDLDIVVTELVKRLQPVVNMPPTSQEEGNDCSRVPLADNIRTHRRRIQNHTQVLRDVLAGLEL
jgi:hypothetical protein